MLTRRIEADEYGLLRSILKAEELDGKVFFGLVDVIMIDMLLENNPSGALQAVYIHRVDLRILIRGKLGDYLRRVTKQLSTGKHTVDLWPVLNSHLQLVALIVAGLTREHSTSRVLEELLRLVLGLHEPNGMTLWRDQVPLLRMYHDSLVQVLARILEAGQSLLQRVVRSLLSMWPRGFNTNTPKELLFLHELDLLLGYASLDDFLALLPALLDLLARSLSHDNCLPMQRALEMFKSSGTLLARLRLCPPEALNAALTQLLPPLYRRGKLFWNPTVNKMTGLALEALLEIDVDAVQAVARAHFSRAAEDTSGASDLPPLPKSREMPSVAKRPFSATSAFPPTGVRPREPAPPAPTDGFEQLQDYIRRCKGGPVDQPSSAHLAAALAPMNLKFHDLVFGRELGVGAFSSVKYAKAILRGQSQQSWPEFAVKVISPLPAAVAEVSEGAGASFRVSLTAALKEIAVLTQLQHPSIAKLVASFRYKDSAYIVLELGARGDLHSLVMTCGPLTETMLRFVAGEVATALLHIHDCGFEYNDLKPENVLLGATGHALLTDFGGCRPVSAEAQSAILDSYKGFLELPDGDWRVRDADATANTEEKADAALLEEALSALEGTPAYMPREILLGRSKGAAVFGKTDAWALGCVMSFCKYLHRHSCVAIE